MPDERFEEHLRPRRAPATSPPAPTAAVAGGAACGDLVAPRVAVEGDRVADAGFDASGCGADASPRRAPRWSSCAARRVLDAARVGTADDRRRARRPEPGQAPRRRARRRRAAPRARARPSAADAALAPAAGRTLVAMSGGVDCAVAALLRARRRRGRASRSSCGATRRTTASASCCSASAVRGARALAHRMGLPHLTLDLRDEFRAGVVEPWLDDHAAGLTPEPVRALQRPRAPRRDARPRRPRRRRDAGHRPLRARTPATACCASPPTPPRTRPTCSPRCRRERCARHALPARRADQARRSARSPPSTGCPSPPSPTRRTSASWPAPAARAFLARHGGLRERPGRDRRRRRARRSARHRGAHDFTVGQRRGLRLGGTASRSTSWTPTPRPTRSPSGRARRWPPTRCACATCACTAPPTEVDAVKLRYRSPAVPCTLRGDARRPRASPSRPPRPARPPSCCAATPCSGCATIAP